MYKNPYGLDMGQTDLALKNLGQPTLDAGGSGLSAPPPTQLTPPSDLSLPEARPLSVANQTNPTPLQPETGPKQGSRLKQIALAIASIYTGGIAGAAIGAAGSMQSGDRQGAAQGILGGITGGGK
jgi:hypothetical protein